MAGWIAVSIKSVTGMCQLWCFKRSVFSEQKETHFSLKKKSCFAIKCGRLEPSLQIYCILYLLQISLSLMYYFMLIIDIFKTFHLSTVVDL